MKNRRISSIFLLTSGALTSLALTLMPSNPAISATLDGFEINTNDDAVKIILHTDERAAYATEQNDQQFSIILKNTKLSQKQLDAGLPVVVDNRNQFIGRAVPVGQDIVKITVPNLPTSQYAISVLQQRGQTTPEKAPEKKPTTPPQVKAKPTTQDAEKALEALVNDKKPSATTVAKSVAPAAAERSAIQKANLKKANKENLSETEKPSTTAISLFPKTSNTTEKPAPAPQKPIAQKIDQPKTTQPKTLEKETELASIKPETAKEKPDTTKLPKVQAVSSTKPISIQPASVQPAEPPSDESTTQTSSPEFNSVPLPDSGPSPKDIAAQTETENNGLLPPLTRHPFFHSSVFQGLLSLAFILLGLPIIFFLLRSIFGVFRPKQRLIYQSSGPSAYSSEHHLEEERTRQRAIQQQLATPQWVEDEDTLIATEAGDIDWIDRAKRVSFMDQTRVVSSPYLLHAPKNLREAVLNTQRLRHQPTRRKVM